MGPSDRVVNLFGALVTGAADRVRAAAQERTGLGGETTAALVVIGHSPGLSIDQLRRVLGLSHPGAVRLVDRLVTAGLVVRETAVRDRRLVHVSLTELGGSLREAVLERRRQVLQALLEPVSSEDLRVLERIAEVTLTTMSTGPLSALSVCRLCDETSCSGCPMDRFGKPE